MSGRLSRGVSFLALLLPAVAFAQVETEPNDTKAQANPFTLPAVTTPAVITGNSTSAAGVGLDYFRVTTAAQATPGFYRHRLVCTSATAGHTVHIRGLNQVAGVPGTTDSVVQASVATTTPPRFIQWYTSEAPGSLYVRVNGAAATTADYSLDYEVQPVNEVITNLHLAPFTHTITSVGQSAPQTDRPLDLRQRTTIVDTATTTSSATSPGSVLTSRTFRPEFHLAISNLTPRTAWAARPMTTSARAS